MSRFVVYIAMSLDGYIADEDGSVHWLEAFDQDLYSYEEFLQSVGSILMGRVTYRQIAGFGAWPYKELPTLVWSRGNVEDLPDGVMSWSKSIQGAAAWLEKHAKDRDVWVLGGAKTIQAFLVAQMVERMDIFIIPVLLGGGTRLFDGEGEETRLLNLVNAQPYANGVVKLSYEMRK